MKKLIVGCCLMLMWSTSYGLNIEGYKLFRSNSDVRVGKYLLGVYHGLETYDFLIQKNLPYRELSTYMDIYFPPSITLNEDDLKSILDAELEVTEYEWDALVSFPLYDALVKAFPCKD